MKPFTVFYRPDNLFSDGNPPLTCCFSYSFPVSLCLNTLR
ncbi:hypothetical protein HMPREF1602_04898 [Escherichia coli 907889]|nr:hypothetical protein EC93001_3848 [Escherichia coli 93-001]ESD31895.1 hypothetical protein HMPREF1602_04898 [Escherichia coli 907889]ESE11253.1 hypothetical protein HMPREF1616_00495 [Escherichia coli 908658]